jgi:hypothetical protein
MPKNLAGKKTVVVSDSDLLFQAIELNLRSGLGVKIVDQAARETETRAGQVDLIVVALSSPASEPVVALAEASLVEWIGQVPLLIISDRPFSVQAGAKILHLEFPFTPDELQDKVREILQEESCHTHSTSQRRPAASHPLNLLG